ncbi:MAG TPA: CHASE3 domain-containing protein [Candidatus Acidoferrales bacterium]
MTFKNRVIAGFGAALAILILVGVLSYRSMVQSDVDRQWVTHTHQVLEELDAVFTDLLDSESSARGYVLTEDTSYIQPYNEALNHVRQHLRDVRELTADNKTQQRALDVLEPLVLGRLDAFGDPIEASKKGGLNAGAELVRTRRGKELMDQVRRQLLAMKLEETRLLILRTDEAAISTRNTRMTIVAGESLAIAFLCFAGIVVGLEMAQRKRAEEKVRELNDDLEQRVADRTAELREQAKELARSNSELQQFAYVASHDLQEPLRMVASFTQLLAKRYGEKLDDDAREFINYAVDGATRMQTLISDLLNYSRVGTQGKPLVPTDCEALFKRVLESLQFTIDESGATILCDRLPMVMADPQQLGQLFQNLLSNAIKFHGAEPSQIRISTERKGTEWKISVRDNGIGISQEHFDRIFVIFQRLHTRTEYPGTGIGLAVCKKIVERHGGRIWIEPSPGGGSTFFFTIQAVENFKLEKGEQNELRVSAFAN